MTTSGTSSNAIALRLRERAGERVSPQRDNPQAEKALTRRFAVAEALTSAFQNGRQRRPTPLPQAGEVKTTGTFVQLWPISAWHFVLEASSYNATHRPGMTARGLSASEFTPWRRRPRRGSRIPCRRICSIRASRH
jgi:hypothetical protein